MALLRAIKRDRDIARLKEGSLVNGFGVRIYYLFLPQEGDSGPPLEVAIRISKRCHRRSVERNRIRRWVREALREWVKEKGVPGGKRLLLLISVCVKGGGVDFHRIRETLRELLGQVELTNA